MTRETDKQRRELYTAMYHIMMMPVDRTGENPLWTSSEPYYDDYYAIWDTYRTSNPLLGMISPDRERDIVRSLVDIYRHTGYMPDARSGNDNGRTQGGSNANVVVADAYMKGIPGIDYKTALQAMIHDTEVPPQNAQKEGRGGLKDYNERGFITTADERAGSRIVEYSYDDFAIAEVACGLWRKRTGSPRSRSHPQLRKPVGPEHDRPYLQGISPAPRTPTEPGPLLISRFAEHGRTSCTKATSGPTRSMPRRT